jgi:soluble lytic murein transglycosylase-like protein
MVVRSCLGQGGCRGEPVRRGRHPRPTTASFGPLDRSGGAASLAALGPADVARYRQIFALQKAGRFGEADQVAKALDDRLLAGHVQAQRYLHPKAYRAEFGELADWLERHAELPQAQRIYRLAGARKPKGARMPAQPAGGYLVGAGQELKEESVGEGFRRRMLPGFDAWRSGDYAAAADRFSALVGNDDRKGEELAAAAFWAARSQLRARRPHLVAGSLRRAARASDGFYGLLAQRLLDETIRFEWQREELRAEMVALLLRYPAAKRAIALAQVGQTDLAEAEVRRLAGRTDDRRDTQALTALAAALELPSAQMRLAQQLRLVDGRRHDGALFPIPRWQTRGGFRVDRALVYAVVRAESAFEIEAESPRGALGLMQVMPDTGNLVAKGANLAYNGPDDLLQPEINLEVGQIWLRRLMRTETVGDSLIHLIVAYNAGETRLKGWLDGELKGAAKQDPLLFIESVPIEETREYVKKVLANLWAYQARLGQRPPRSRPWPRTAGPAPAGPRRRRACRRSGRRRRRRRRR